MRLYASRRYTRSLRKFAKKRPDFESKIARSLIRLRTNPKHPSLRLHKIDDCYSISIDMSIRIIFSWENDEIILLDIGTHEEVYE